MAVDSHLAIANLAQRAGVLPRHANGGLALLGEAGVVEDQGRIALGGQVPQILDALLVEIVVVPGHGREQALQGLFGGARDDSGNGVAVLVGMFGEHPGEVAFQGVGGLGTGEVDVEGTQKLVQCRHWRPAHVVHVL